MGFYQMSTPGPLRSAMPWKREWEGGSESRTLFLRRIYSPANAHLRACLPCLGPFPFITGNQWSRLWGGWAGDVGRGGIVLRKNRYPHLHLLAEWHELAATGQGATGHRAESAGSVAAPPPRWTIIHGFIAGFGFGGFSLFVNTVAAPAMPSPWLGLCQAFCSDWER